MSHHTRPVADHSTHPGLVRPFAGTRTHPPNILPLHLQSVHDAHPSVHNAWPRSTQILCRYMHLSSIPIPYIRPALCKCSFRLNIDSASTLQLPISLTPVNLHLLREPLRIHPSRAFGPLWGCGPSRGHCPAVCTLSSTPSLFWATLANP